LPEGLTNYQLKQWHANFNELCQRMLLFGFTDEVRASQRLIRFLAKFCSLNTCQQGDEIRVSSAGDHRSAL
jgi:hypothetical protein